MTRKELIQAVTVRMDELTANGNVIVEVNESDNNPLFTLIDKLIEEGVQELYSVAPYWRLPQTEFAQSDILVEPITPDDTSTRYIIRIKVPDSFLRLAEISCKEFVRPITEVYAEESDIGRRQHNRFLRARVDKPVAVMSFGKWSDNALIREIDCYSLSSETPSSLLATYISKPNAIDTSDNTANAVESVVPPVLMPALSWLLAGKAFSAMGDVNHAQIAIQNETNLLQ